MAKKILAVLVTVLLGVLHPVGIATPTAQGPQEGIKVHGHWAIDIRQADGTLVTHREFDNALENAGGLSLINALGRFQTLGDWHVAVFGNVGPCGGGCFIFEPTSLSPPFDANRSNNLTVSVNSALVLVGSIVATQDGDIAAVTTSLERCPTSISPTNCHDITQIYPFTHKNLASPIPVVAGQTIQVKVTISFS